GPCAARDRLPAPCVRAPERARTRGAGGGLAARRLPPSPARAARRAGAGARRARVPRRVGGQRAWLAAPLLSAGLRRAALRPDARGRARDPLARRARAAGL